MASFDIVSELNMQELENAIHIAQKEIQSRYDCVVWLARGRHCYS